MEQREKLIELIGDSLCCPKETDCADCEYKKYELCTETMVADYLLSNGVVVLPCRCGDCAYAGEVPCRDIWCTKEQCYVKPDGYCHRAERKGW